MNTDNKFSVKVNPQPSQFETTIREVPKSEIELDIAVQLPDSDQKNTLTSLEDAIIEKFGHDPSKLSMTERDNLLQEIRPSIKNISGHLPKSDPNKAESPVEFETYVAVPERDSSGKIVKDDSGNPKPFLYGLQAKMKWEVELNINGKTEKLQLLQNVQVPRALPRNPEDLAGLEHTKHTSLLYLKTFRQLHKKALLGDQYKLTTDVEKMTVQDKLIKGLRSSNHLKIAHYPNPFVYSAHLYRVGTGLSAGDGSAHYADVEFEGYKISLGYGENAVKGRKLQHYKVGDELPNGAGKAKVAMTKYIKVHVGDPKYNLKRFYDPNKKIPDPDGVSYGTHLYQMASKATVKGPPLTSYEGFIKSNSRDLKNEVQRDSSVDVDRLVGYETHLMEKNLQSFENKENALRFEIMGDQAPNFITGALFSQDSKVREMTSNLADQFQDLISQNNLAGLQLLYQNSADIKQLLGDLKEGKEKIEKGINHLSQLGPKSGKTEKEVKDNKQLHAVLLQSLDGELKAVEQKMDFYTDLASKMNQAEGLLKQNNLI